MSGMPRGDGYGRRSTGFGGARLLVGLLMAGLALFSYMNTKSTNPVTGESQHISIRPEQIQVCREEIDGDDDGVHLGPNRVRARVTASLFLGDRRELQVETPRGQKARVYAPLSDHHLEGESIVLDLPEQHVKIWPVDDAPGESNDPSEGDK